MADRCRFDVASAKSFPGRDYDFVTVFDALHDMGDPGGAARRGQTTRARRRVDDRRAVRGRPGRGELSPLGGACDAGWTLMGTPCSLAQEVGVALGAPAGEARMRDVVDGSGSTHFRRAAQIPLTPYPKRGRDPRAVAARARSASRPRRPAASAT